MTGGDIGPRILVLGAAGSGKTTLARAVARHFAIEHHELDWLAWKRDMSGQWLDPDELDALAVRIANEDAWVVDGAYIGWTRPVAARADLIVWLDVPMRVALWRIFWRHVKAELRRDNKFPGWRNLLRFLGIVRRQYRGEWQGYGPSDPGPSPANLESFVADFRDKSVRCRSMTLSELSKLLEIRRPWLAQTRNAR